MRLEKEVEEKQEEEEEEQKKKYKWLQQITLLPPHTHTLASFQSPQRYLGPEERKMTLLATKMQDDYK